MSIPYPVRAVEAAPDLHDWESPSWRDAAEITLDHARPEGSDHRPAVRVRVVRTATGLHGMFQVEDRYVRCVHHGFNAPVCRDSCVEFFCQPNGQGPYFNFEFNCGGSLLVSRISDPTRTPDGFARFAMLTENDLRQVTVVHSLPDAIEPELPGPLTWTLGFAIPFAMLEKYLGPVDPATLTGTVWRGNFYKCADRTSHPHWLSWQPVSSLNFHLPECFGELLFV